jgi:hypothetical protein
MRIETALSRITTAQRALTDLYSTAVICKLPASDITRNKLIIIAAMGKAPQWARSRVEGYAQCLYNLHWQNLEFCYNVEGVLYSTHKKSDKPTTEIFYSTGKGSVLSNAIGSHYYKGTDKQF